MCFRLLAGSLAFGLFLPAVAEENTAQRKRIADLLPAISASDTWVMAHDGESYLFNPGAGLEKVPFLSGVYKSFGFSHDSRYFLYLKSNGRLPAFSLYRYDLAEGTEKLISNEPVHFAFWSPASLDIAFVASESAVSFRLFVHRAERGRNELVTEGSLDPEIVEWSPDGSRLMYVEQKPLSTSAIHDNNYEFTAHEYSVESKGRLRSFPGRWVRYQGTTPLTVSPSSRGMQQARMSGVRSIPNPANEDIHDFVVNGDLMYATIFDEGRPRVKVYREDEDAWQTVEDGTIYTSVRDGIVVRQLSPEGVRYTYLPLLVAAAAPANYAFNGTWKLPFAGSSYFMQGGALFSNGACDGRVCLVIGHKGKLGNALDWQQTPEDGQGNKHVLAVADGTVAATLNTATCNSVTPGCTVGDAYRNPCNDGAAGAGNHVIIAHPDGSYSMYGHMRSGSIQVAVGQSVVQGDYLGDQGHSGSAGSATNYLGCGEHLHFQRQYSPAIWSQSVPTDFTELPCSISCYTPYVSQNVETATPPVIALTVQLTPSVLGEGGASSANKVIIPTAAPQGGATVTLTSSNPVVAGVPPSVSIPEGSTWAAFPVSAGPVASSQAVSISADYNGSAAAASLTVNPIAVAGIELALSQASGMLTLTANTVSMTGPVSTDTTVALTVNQPSVASVPASVVVPAGASSVPFTLTLTPVTSQVWVGVTATLNGISKSAWVIVKPLSLSSINLARTTIVGGTSTVANTVTLNGAAGPGNVDVPLTSSNPAVASVPAAATVPPGSYTSGNWTITTAPVTTPTSVTISGMYGGAWRGVTLNVVPLTVSSLTLSPSTVGAGASSIATVTMSGVVASDTLVSLSSSDPAATVPPTVTVLAGASTAKFAVTTSGAGTVAITASYGTSSASANLTVNGVSLSTVNLSPNTVVGGVSTTNNTVSLNGPAPAAGAVVTLSSSDPAVAAVPASVTVAAGSSTSPKFTITTTTLTASTPVTITATYNGISRTAVLTVGPAALNTLTLSPATISGGSPTTGNTVSLTGPAPAGGALVTLSSSNPAVAAVPASLTIPAGATTSSAFTITTTAVSGSTTVNITANYAGVSRTATLTVGPLTLTSLVVSPTFTAGGITTTGNQVRLNGPAPAGGMTVNLTSSDPAVASVPATVVIAAGATSANFSIVTTTVTSLATVTVTASTASSTRTATLDITPPSVGSVSLSPALLVSGATSTNNRVNLNGPAPAGGAVVTISNGDPATATVPSSITVPAGAWSGTFSITAGTVSTSKTISLGATAWGNITRSANLTVEPFGIKGITLRPWNPIGGNTSTQNEVALNAPAPAGGVVVTLTSDDPLVASVPASITIPAGMASKYFTIQTSGVAAQTPVLITATMGTSTRTATPYVQPASLSTVTLAPATLTGGASSTLTINLDGAAPPNGAVIALSSSNPAAVVPASVTIAGGARSVQVPVTTNSVPGQTIAVISTTYSARTVSASLTIN